MGLNSVFCIATLTTGFWPSEGRAQQAGNGELVGRSVKAINYQHRGGATKIDFRGTQLLSGARGAAKVESKRGHTDSVGGTTYNQGLSERRADAVRNYLIEQGIQANTITARGFGELRPKATNDTVAGRQQNRRVELVVSGGAIGTGDETEPR